MHRNIFHGQAQTAQSVVPGVPRAGIWARHGNAVLGKIKAVSNGILREMERIRKLKYVPFYSPGSFQISK